MTVTDDRRAGLGRKPRQELTRERIAARIEAGDRRAFWALVRALDTRILEWIVDSTEEQAGHGEPMPWHLVSYRCARAEMARRTRGPVDL